MQPGTKVGPYEILARIGEGGMGEVYKARDTRLDRTVAIKQSAEEFSQRFEREAHAIAALNHPHICTLFDVGPDYLVMELIEGKPLTGPLPANEAVRFGIQIADALDAAHRRGIVHRDLKPGNVLLAKSGVKLLDFGLAVRRGAADNQATQAIGLTQQGTIVGTPQYMAPEQIEGAEADARTDIFAFGALLAELITGKKAFEGKTAASVMAAVLREPPTNLDDVPAGLRRIISRCLEKDPEDRFQNARDIMHALQEWKPEAPVTATAAIPPRHWWITAAACLVTAVAGAAAVYWRLPRPAAEEYRLSVTPPADAPFEFGTSMGGSVISPDGRTIAFVARNSLWLRPVNSLAARNLANTDGAYYPFWSPDSKAIGFFSATGLRHYDLATGNVLEISRRVGGGRGAAWNPRGIIVFSDTTDRTLQQVPARGGAVSPVTRIDESRQEFSHYWPHFLPDGERFLYSVRASESSSGIFVGSLKDPKLKIHVSPVLSKAAYMISSVDGAGYLIFVRGDALLAQRFDLTAMRLTGDPMQLSDNAGFQQNVFLANFSVANNGAILLGSKTTSRRQLTWVDRQGRRLGAVGPVGDFLFARLSPDASRALITAADMATLSAFEFSRGVMTRVATGNTGIWSPDGKEILFRSAGNLYRRRFDAVGNGELWRKNPGYPADWSRQGVILIGQTSENNAVAWADGSHPDRNISTPGAIGAIGIGSISPDGKWLAYTSIESGRREIYVTGLLDSTSRWQVSDKGGEVAVWSRDGKELFYSTPGGEMMSVLVTTNGAGLVFNAARTLFRSPGHESIFDVAPDGRFLFLAPPEHSAAEREPLTLLINWQPK